MVILGLSDGLETGAAVVVDDRLVAVSQQSRLDGRHGSRGLPWPAVDAVLGQAGLGPSDIDVVALAGRITPPFFVRRHPTLRGAGRDPFSPALDASVFYQAVLRGTGIAAMEADRAAEWLERQLRRRGFDPSRVVTVDVHKALAASAYRGQDRDSATILTLHPMGDGAAVAVHRAKAGQVDRVWDQKGFSRLHTHLHRCASSVGLALEDLDLLWSWAGRAEPDPDLVRSLDALLHADGPRLSRKAYPLPTRRQSEVYAALSAADPLVSAASILENLSRAVCDLTRHHVRERDTDGLILGGAVFDNPRLCARVAEMPEVRWTAAFPEPGWGALAAGAALTYGGLHPRRMALPGVGKEPAGAALNAATRASGFTKASAELVDSLASGQAVAHFAGPEGWGPHGCGSRAVLVRADRPEAVDAARRALGRDPYEDPGLAWLADEARPHVPLLPELGGGARYGVFAPVVSADAHGSIAGAVAPDGRALLYLVDEEHPRMWQLLNALREKTGCAALAMWPLGLGRDPLSARPADALQVTRRSGLRRCSLGDAMVELA